MKKSRVLLVCHLSATVGIGHLSRLLALAKNLKQNKEVYVEFLIFGDLFKEDELSNFDTQIYPIDYDIDKAIDEFLDRKKIKVIVFDLYPNLINSNLGINLKRWKSQDIILVGIDSLLEFRNIFNLIWIPSFNFDLKKYSKSSCIIRSGWDCFLIEKRFNHKYWQQGNKVLVLTGGSDLFKLGETFPAQIDKSLNEDTEITWVRGPFSEPPKIPKERRLQWLVIEAPNQIDELIVNSNYVISVFGVSFFETLQYGIPSVVFSPYGNKDNHELSSLYKENVASVADNPKLAVLELKTLMNDSKLARNYSKNALKKMSSNGAQNLSIEILDLAGKT